MCFYFDRKFDLKYMKPPHLAQQAHRVLDMFFIYLVHFPSDTLGVLGVTVGTQSMDETMLCPLWTVDSLLTVIFLIQIF